MGKINPLKHAYPVNVRLAGLAGIALVIIIFIIFPRFLASMEFEDVDQIIIENIDIPQTQQIDNTPPPARPSIPVPLGPPGPRASCLPVPLLPLPFLACLRLLAPLHRLSALPFLVLRSAPPFCG